MQKITLIGHLGTDVQEKTFGEGRKVLNFSIAASLTKDKTVWYDCTIWPERAHYFKNIIPHLKKGSYVMIMGDLGEPDVYQSKSGETRVKGKVQPFSIQFINTGRGEKKEEEKKPSLFEEEEGLPF